MPRQQNPISGYGGQSCLESVAAFINALKPALEMDASTGAGGLTDADFDSIFAGIQKSRMKRIQTLLKGSRAMADILSLKGIARYLLPAIVQVTGQQGQLMRFANSWASATRLDHLPIPKRSRMVPYNDELPADRIKSSLPKLITITALMASFYLSWAGTALPEGVPFSSWAGAHPTLSNYTGTGLDGTLGIMSSFFSYMLVPEDPIPRFQAVELLTIFVSLQAIWMVEANRKANALSLIRLSVRPMNIKHEKH